MLKTTLPIYLIRAHTYIPLISPLYLRTQHLNLKLIQQYGRRQHSQDLRAGCQLRRERKRADERSTRDCEADCMLLLLLQCNALLLLIIHAAGSGREDRGDGDERVR